MGIPFTDVPLVEAVKHLAGQLRLDCVVGPDILAEREHAPSVTVNWENLTVRQAWMALLESRNLERIPNPQTGVARIARKAAATGTGVMTGVGWVLARVAAAWRLWLALFAASALGLRVLMLSEFPSLERALSKNGPWWAYGCSAALMGSHVAGALSLVLGPLLRWRQRQRAPLQ